MLQPRSTRSQETIGGASYSVSSLLTPASYTFSGPDLCHLWVFGKDSTYTPFKADCIQSCRSELQRCRDDIFLRRLLPASGNQVWDLVEAGKVSVRLVGLPDLHRAWKEPVNSKAPRRLETCEDELTGCLVVGKYVSCLSSGCPHWVITDY